MADMIRFPDEKETTLNYLPMLLSKDTTFIIGPIATLLGYLMNGIFWVLSRIGLPNTGLSIIIFTIIIYMALMPLTVRQQKFSKLQQIMQPELTKIQKKYQNRKDQDSMMKQNEETQALYKKYGVSPMGSCVQLLIQMPILFALYRVIYNIPAYVTEVKQAFFPLVDLLISKGSAASEYLQSTSAASNYARHFTNESFTSGVTSYVQNTFIDVLNRFSTGDWQELSAKFSDLSGDISTTVTKLERYNNFLGLNIGNSPWFTFRQAITAGSIIGIIAAVIVPVLAAVTQLINVALMPTSTSSTGNEQADSMANSMKTMNYIMPIMSAFFCFTLPAGMGLYWIAGSVIRSIQQVTINRSVDRMDMDAYLKKQEEKNRKKAEKRGDKPTAYQRMMEYSNMNTRNDPQALSNSGKNRTLSQKAGYQNRTGKSSPSSDTKQQTADSGSAAKHYRKGSLAEKANMVQEYNQAGRSSSSRSSRKK